MTDTYFCPECEDSGTVSGARADLLKRAALKCAVCARDGGKDVFVMAFPPQHPTCDRCGASDDQVRHDSASGINLHEPATCPIMVAGMPPASSPAHDPVTCTCCQIALGATKERDAREAGRGEAFDIVLDRLTDAERKVVKARAEIARLRDALGICHAAMKQHDYDVTGTVELMTGSALFSAEREIARHALELDARSRRKHGADGYAEKKNT